MANLEDFENVLMDLVHDYAGDDHLEEFGSVAQSMVLLAAQKERERIINLLVTSDAPIWLCNLCNGNFTPLGTKQVRKALGVNH